MILQATLAAPAAPRRLDFIDTVLVVTEGC